MIDARQRIAEVLTQLEAEHTETGFRYSWDSEAAHQQAYRLAREAGYQGDDDLKCNACNLEVINTLRIHIGRAPLRSAVPESQYQARIDICRGDPDKNIPRCPSLADGFKFIASPPFVQFKNANCTACHCFVDAKAAISWETCPLEKWKPA
jgi:hypothetical protein